MEEAHTCILETALFKFDGLSFYSLIDQDIDPDPWILVCQQVFRIGAFGWMYDGENVGVIALDMWCWCW